MVNCKKIIIIDNMIEKHNKLTVNVKGNVNTKQDKKVAPTESEKYQVVYDEIMYATSFKDGIIYFFGEIDDTSIYRFMTCTRGIMSAREIDGKPINDPITIILNSPGGSIMEMYGIIDYMRYLKQTKNVVFNVVVRGMAASAAAIILTAGTGVRVASKHSTIMLHEPSSWQEGKMSEIKAGMTHVEHLEDVMYDILSETTKQSKDFWQNKLRKDFWLNATEALELGLIDEII